MKKMNWNLDPAHSELRFKVRHLMIASVSGSFKNFDVQMQTEGDDFSTAKISVTADIDSVTTGNEQRDAHLLNTDFFDAPNFPQLQFKSDAIEKADDENFILHGALTLKGISQPVKLNVEYSGLAKDPWGNERAGFVVTTKINRSEWGISFNNVLDSGGLALSDEVKISGEIQMVKEVVGVPA